MKQLTIALLMFIASTVFFFVLWTNSLASQVPKPAPIDTLVVIRETYHVDSGWKGHVFGVRWTGDQISPYILFPNGKQRDTIYESKIVYDK